MLIAAMLWTDLYDRVSLEMVLQSSSIFQFRSLSMSDTTLASKVFTDKSHSSTLNSFKLIFVLLVVGIPNT